MNKNHKAELLSPCGNFDCVKAAVNAGADAVYLGGQLFNARAFASNFDNAELEKVCDLCHRFGVKVYVTVNTLYKDEEFELLLPFIDSLYTMGADGLIMQDPGAIRLTRQHWPDLPVHASTQLTANCLEDVLEMEALGLRTVVLSRELSLDEIRHIAANTAMRVETFIHGALCVSYSGQCLMSSVLGNRSGNRGKCAQNCRLPYRLAQSGKELASGHLLSTKDICTLPLLPELLDAGVVSLKIEGRMKTPEYVAGVTGIYRKYLDLYYSGKPYRVDPEDMRILRQLFNRGNFSEGYLRTHSGFSMMCPTHPKAWGVKAGKVLSYDGKKRQAAVRFDRDMVPGDGIEIRTGGDDGTGCYVEKPCGAGDKLFLRVEGPVAKDQAVYQTYDKRLMDSLKPLYAAVTRKAHVSGKIRLHQGEPSELTFTNDRCFARVYGEEPVPAQNQPLTPETIREQIAKLGSTIFTLDDLTVEMDEGIFLNRSALNELKNRAAQALEEHLTASSKRISRPAAPEMPSGSPASPEKTLTVSVRGTGAFEAALQCASVSAIYLEMRPELMEDLTGLTCAAHREGKKLFIRLPRIFRDYVQKNIAPWLEQCKTTAIDGFIISSLGHYHAVKDQKKAIRVDFTGNVLNSRSAAFWGTLGAEKTAVSPEMSVEEINALADRSRTELLAYGRLPLMVTHQCPIGNFAGGKKDRIRCQKAGHREPYTLLSDKGNFPLDTDCRNCVCTILSEEPLDIRDGIHAFNADTFRLDFTTESPDEVRQILKTYGRILKTPSAGSNADPGIYRTSVL